jgi:hypothetical protein
VASIAVNEPRPTLPTASRAALAHIPGSDGFPIVGDTFRFLADPLGSVQEMARRYGLVRRSRVFGIRTVGLRGPDGIGLVLFDQAKLFSSAQGWGPFLDCCSRAA